MSARQQEISRQNEALLTENESLQEKLDDSEDQCSALRSDVDRLNKLCDELKTEVDNQENRASNVTVERDEWRALFFELKEGIEESFSDQEDTVQVILDDESPAGAVPA
ncbi:hypothetical protein [Salipiger mucosus]|uniref:Uncharacterized protein n=1 Tax=Salipiger mucosus DSM 16094 TaxID=1123237 RepID=S9RZR6_9RHOB|nr:hypothetical protein [Salipiger mucosus]EPX83480.1 hypothetical protein Salmuc_02088 [Salipiger mucosus DSM 16094]